MMVDQNQKLNLSFKFRVRLRHREYFSAFCNHPVLVPFSSLWTRASFFKMWQEARKQEKKLRGMMVDHKKRAERRREYYEHIVSFPL